MPVAFKFGASGSQAIFGAAASPFADSAEATLISDAIVVRQRSVTEMAPEAIVFGVDVSTLTTPLGISAPVAPEVHDNRLLIPTFKWTFGDSYDFTSSTNTANLNSGEAINPAVQHTYRSAGTYSVRVDIYMPNGDRFYSTLSVTVGAFSGTTITVGPSGRDHTRS